MSETAENSAEEAGEGTLDAEAGEMTDGGEDDYDEEGSTDLVWSAPWGKRDSIGLVTGDSNEGSLPPLY